MNKDSFERYLDHEKESNTFWLSVCKNSFYGMGTVAEGLAVIDLLALHESPLTTASTFLGGIALFATGKSFEYLGQRLNDKLETFRQDQS